MSKKHLIGFTLRHEEVKEATDESPENLCKAAPKHSVVSVYFPQKKRSLTYYNDHFDLKEGSLVFVDGKMAGFSGFVEAVNFKFKIKLSDYQRVIAVADTEIHGTFHRTRSFALSFDKDALPKDKIRTWFFLPVDEDETFVCGCDEEFFSLADVRHVIHCSSVSNRTYECYHEENVLYLSLYDTEGYAIVMGSRPYEVEFRYQSGEIFGLVCSCYCCNDCSHEYAALLELCEIFKVIQERFENEYEVSSYFSAVREDLVMKFIDEEEGLLQI